MISNEFQYLFSGIREKLPELKDKVIYPNIGDMITFHYNTDLSLYDKFPLVLVLSVDKINKSFFGLNLNYIPIEGRLNLILGIQKVYVNKVDVLRYLVNSGFFDKRNILNTKKRYDIASLVTNIKIYNRDEINKIIKVMKPEYEKFKSESH